MPSNSNFLHTLCLNNVEVRTVKQGVFRHSIAGLTPNTPYRITVRAKNIKAMAAQSASWTGGGNVTKQLDTLSSHIEIRTLPQGLPDPPLDVQVDAGPEPGTLNVLWLPVTITQFGLSNGAPVTGYVVYADGESVQDIDDPTADCATISLSKVRGGTIKAVSVRTKSKDKLSVDSSSCPVPSCFLGEARDVVQPSQPAAAAQVQHPAAKSTKAFAVDDLDSADEDSETELLEKLQARTGISNTINSSNNTNTGMSGSRQRELIINYSGYPELDSDIGPSELSGRKNAFYITLNFCTYRSIYFSSFIFLKRDCGPRRRIINPNQ
jgi:RIMS-binding protein 2